MIYKLISNIPARKKLLEMQRGYVVTTEDDPDELIYAGFSKETAKSFIENFEKYLEDNKDSMKKYLIPFLRHGFGVVFLISELQISRTAGGAEFLLKSALPAVFCSETTEKIHIECFIFSSFFRGFVAACVMPSFNWLLP